MKDFYHRHIVFVNEKGKNEIRGRWFLLLAAVIGLGGNYIVARAGGG